MCIEILHTITFIIQVSLDSKVKEKLMSVRHNPTEEIFDEAQSKIYSLMHRDSFSRFMNLFHLDTFKRLNYLTFTYFLMSIDF